MYSFIYIYLSLMFICYMFIYLFIYLGPICVFGMIYLLNAIGLPPGGSSTVQYTFTHKQYTEQHNATEYPERNVHNNKNT